MKKSIAIFAAFLCLSVQLNAARQNQAKISGVITDKATGAPLEFVTVALRLADSTVVAGGMTAADGRFSLEAPAGTYRFEASFVGYHTYCTETSVPSALDVLLEEDSEQLAAARVTERVPLVEMKVDKLVMNVSQSAFAQGSNGLELLRKAPGVTVDKDGNVKLNGKKVQVWIDGRPSYLDGESLQALLRSTAGDSIDKFELMEHPSAKYDAAGQGGIINIKTKKNFAQGFNGSVGFDAGGMYFSEMDKFQLSENAWANFAYRGKKTNTTVNLYEGRFDNGCMLTTNTSQSLPLGDMALQTSSLQEFTFSNWQVKLANDWFLGDKDILGVILTFPGSNSSNVSSPDRNTSVTKFDGIEVERTASVVDNSSTNNRLTGNLNYTHTFDASRSAELTANLDWYRSGGPTVNDQLNHITAGDLAYDTRRLISSSNLVNIYSAKVDYQTVLWSKAMLEAGAKWATSVTDNDTDREETGRPLTNTVFCYREHIGAAYASLSMQVNPKWSFKAGLRGEYTNSLGDWKSIGQQTKRDYFDLFPTVFVGYNPSEKLRFALSYTRRVNRPGYYVLDPVEQYMDAHTYTVGNPDLLPEYSDGLYLVTGLGSHFNFTIGYDHTGNMTTQIPEIRENGDQVLTWGNFGKCRMGVAAASISALPIARWLEWSLNLNGVYMNNESAADGFVNASWTFSGYTSFTFLLPRSWKFELDGLYTSPMAWGHFLTSPQYRTNLAVKKTMLDGRLNLSLNVKDILRSNRADMDVVGLGAATSFIRQQYYSQAVTAGLTWSFGQAHQTRYRKVGDLEEASRVGSGSTSIGKN